MTLPTLIANYQKQMYVNGLKKQYSLWSNAFKSILAAEGVSSLSDTTVFKSIPGSCGYYSSDPNGVCKEFYNKLSQYVKFSVIKLEKNYTASHFNEKAAPGGLGGYGKNQYVILTADGGMIARPDFLANPEQQKPCEDVYKSGGKFCKRIGSLHLDVNGLRGPNKLGRDVFWIYLSDDGNLYPVGSKDYAIFFARAVNYTWDSHPSWCGYPENPAKNNGEGCGARVIDEGWKMNY